MISAQGSSDLQAARRRKRPAESLPRAKSARDFQEAVSQRTVVEATARIGVSGVVAGLELRLTADIGVRRVLVENVLDAQRELQVLDAAVATLQVEGLVGTDRALVADRVRRRVVIALLPVLHDGGAPRTVVVVERRDVLPARDHALVDTAAHIDLVRISPVGVLHVVLVVVGAVQTRRHLAVWVRYRSAI